MLPDLKETQEPLKKLENLDRRTDKGAGAAILFQMTRNLMHFHCRGDMCAKIEKRKRS